MQLLSLLSKVKKIFISIFIFFEKKYIIIGPGSVFSKYLTGQFLFLEGSVDANEILKIIINFLKFGNEDCIIPSKIEEGKTWGDWATKIFEQIPDFSKLLLPMFNETKEKLQKDPSNVKLKKELKFGENCCKIFGIVIKFLVGI